MKLITYVIQFQSGEKEQREKDYLVCEAEFKDARAAWEEKRSYYCERLEVYLPKPSLPVETPVRYSRFVLFCDPQTNKEYAKADDGKFYEVSFDATNPKPDKFSIATGEALTRLCSVEEYPKILPLTSFSF